MRQLQQDKALVLFSGGQDSAIALVWALDHFAHVETIGFDYGQRHRVELEARANLRREIIKNFPQWATRLGDDLVVEATGLKSLGESAMTHEMEIAMNEDGLPTTFVPGRNLLFLTLSGAYAYRRNIGTLVAGMCEADYSGYPDCRAAAIDAQADALRRGMDCDLTIETPLMHIDKAESWRKAAELGGDVLVAIINEHSHTCYKGMRGDRHAWGYGCGACPACELRANGWAAFNADRHAS